MRTRVRNGPPTLTANMCVRFSAVYLVFPRGRCFSSKHARVNCRSRKLQSGSPVKAAHLDIRKRTTSLVYDPRPTHLRKLHNYNSDVRSLVVNSCFKPKIAMNQMYGPVNPYALDADHSYLPGRQSDWFS